MSVPSSPFSFETPVAVVVPVPAFKQVNRTLAQKVGDAGSVLPQSEAGGKEGGFKPTLQESAMPPKLYVGPWSGHSSPLPV